MKEEVWKPIKGFEQYEVSNLGRVKRLAYNKNIRNGGKQPVPEHVLIGSSNNNGYKTVQLHSLGKVKFALIHRLVADAFIPNPNSLPEVNHKDECKHNNSVDNLEWCTHYYNGNYGTSGKRISQKLTNGKQSKAVRQYALNGDFIKEFPSVSEAGRVLNISTSSITRCCNGQKKYSQCGGYQWRYVDNNKPVEDISVTIVQYSKDGVRLNTFGSVGEAAKETNVWWSNISHCIAGRAKTAGGYIWRKE